MDLAHAANRGVILDSCQEGRHEGADRVWRRWQGFCESTGIGSDPLLIKLSELERELFAKAFLQRYRTADWTPDGKFARNRKQPLGGGTLRQAASNLGAAFRMHFRESPLHIPGSTHMRPTVRSLLKAFDNVDAPKKQQRAMTPKLLRAMFEVSGAGVGVTKDSTMAATAEIAIVAYFFAMRSCEITSTPAPGRTKIIHLRGVTATPTTRNLHTAIRSPCKQPRG